MNNEIFLGFNLNRAIREYGVRNPILDLDGRERRNPASNCRVQPGAYRVTRTSGSAPGEVGYWGIPE
jgi:hypothetical protein